MDRAQWPVTTVSYFFSALPWQGLVAPLPEQTRSLDFRLLSVKDFFTSITWTGQVQLAPASDSVRGLSYQMSVRQFFSHVVWQGRPSIGVVPQLEGSPPKAPDLNLLDLSDLF